MWLGSKTRLCLLDESLPNSQDSQDDSITWYTTGDLVRVHHHKYYFTSRVDDVFKVRGTKVQPSQICDALNAHEAVLASYVLPVQHIQTGSDPMIVAFVVPRKGIEPLDERTLFQFIKPALPTVMWPHFIWVVPGFALSPNGKTDKTAMTRQAVEFLAANWSIPPSVFPQDCLDTSTTTTLLLQLLDVLDIPLGSSPLQTTYFVQLGGNSSTALQLVIKLADQITTLKQIPVPSLVRELLFRPLQDFIDFVLASQDRLALSELDQQDQMESPSSLIDLRWVRSQAMRQTFTSPRSVIQVPPNQDVEMREASNQSESRLQLRWRTFLGKCIDAVAPQMLLSLWF